MAFITEEMLLKKFNGDRVVAAYYAQALVNVIEEDYLKIKEELDPEGPYMKALIKEINEDLDWEMMTPWWKKVLVRIGVMIS